MILLWYICLRNKDIMSKAAVHSHSSVLVSARTKVSDKRLVPMCNCEHSRIVPSQLRTLRKRTNTLIMLLLQL